MPDEYISRAKALSAVQKQRGANRSPAQNDMLDRICRNIKNMPAADVAEVVRCKDCKHRTEYGNCGHPRRKGVFPSAYPFDFCSYGKYKTNTGGATE